MGIAEDLIIIIIVGLVTGLIANRLKIPPIIGYIIAGIIIGPYTGGVTVSDVPRIELLAEIGVALLLFSIGLDFSFRELRAVKGIALVGTPIQIVLLIAMGYGFGHFMNMPWNESLILGMIISLSSTMVVIKTLMSRGLMGTLSSRVMIGILIIQDLAAIPLMLIIPRVKELGGDLMPLVLTLGKAGLILAAIIVVGMRVIPWILKFVARINSRELFLITITAIGLGVGYLTHAAGLSLAFGAFVAGMVVSESDYSHQALSDIIPLRDIFGLVFFTSIGMLLDMGFILDNLSMVLVLALLIVAGKFLVFFLLSLSFRYYNIMPLALGLGLAQVGEFSFVLARTGLQSGIISSGFFSLVLAVSVITMIISPFLSMLAVPLYSLKKKLFRHEEISTVNMPERGLNEHIVIVGGGRVGFQIASILYQIEFPFIVIEQDFRRFEKCKDAGFPVIFGDAAQEAVLSGAKTANARLVLITIPLMSATREIILTTRRYNPGVKIIVRADDVSHAEELFKMDIFEVVQPEFEASLEILRKSLMILDVPLMKIQEFCDTLRSQNRMHSRIDSIKSSLLANIKKTPFLLEMNWFEVDENSPVPGKTIRDLAVRSRTGASIVGVIRESEFVANPGADFEFRTGDYIAVIGLSGNKKVFSDMMMCREC
ncbi:MAG: portal protein [Spirochaetae bacterium HGW-Spirochaetae-1]|jgi:CPA2 family monovalent cation:H+ antiporter-2|nr:MAG: portal protein [Spirochaetae bacterium HGW-Spirochaetae-1]